MTFKTIRTIPHPDKKATVTEYVHEQTGMKHFHLDSPFPEKNFAVSLSTPPVDDTGMPHILEHLTLCGGQKYPSKDPFMAMQYRSVAHSMNAHTTPDHTAYHFSTTVESDFANLSDLYLDLVFCPLLRKADFEQEGWRLDRDEKSGWKLKGVVLNEMKGVYSDPSGAFFEAIMQTYLSGTPYARNYGGHPVAIPALSYERLQQFHQAHYRPEKAVVATSGAIDIAQFHERLEQAIARHLASRSVKDATQLGHVDPAPASAFYQLPTSATANGLHVEVAGPEQTPGLFTKLYTRQAPAGPEGELFDQMMTTALFSSASSMLEKIFNERGQGHASANYMFNGFKESQDKVGLMFAVQGAGLEEQKELDQIIDTVWTKTLERGLRAEDWKEAAMQVRKPIEANVDASPMSTLFDMSQCSLIGMDPLNNANNLAILEKLEKQIPTQDDVGHWCQGFLQNPQPSLSITANPRLTAQWDAMEKNRVEEMVISGATVSGAVKPEENFDLLPCIQSDQLTIPDRHDINAVKTPAGVRAAAHTHWDVQSPRAAIGVFWDVGSLNLSQRDQFLLGAWTNFVSNLGTRDEKYERHQTWEDQNGISTSWSFGPEGRLNGEAGLVVSCSASGLETSSDQISQALRDRTAGVPTFEPELWQAVCNKIKDQVSSSQSKMQKALAQQKALAPFSNRQTILAMQNQYNQDHQLQWLATATPEVLREAFEHAWSLISKAPKHVISVGSEKTRTSASKVALGPGPKAWDDLAQWSPVSVDKSAINPGHVHAETIINHCYKAHPAPRFGEQSAPNLDLAMNLLSPWLHENVREKGGAYGSSVSWSSGVCVFSSYRDPNVEETFEVFRQAPIQLNAIIEQAKDEDLRGAKITMFKSMCRPQTSFTQALEMMKLSLGGISWETQKEHTLQAMRLGWSDLGSAAQWLASAPSSEVALTSAPALGLAVQDTQQKPKTA